MLKILLGNFEPTRGAIRMPEGVVFAYVPQLIDEPESLSGGERFNRPLSKLRFKIKI
ncbi:MAG: hypothetical protein LN589_04700 [Rickettsia endosymbiont of Eriopis connexa]|nr:hypothetical protein [Rickettsia endosymbiont of Eriopis connexa]